jgi:uncharacterized membrane protein YhaH (DUF805 family)
MSGVASYLFGDGAGRIRRRNFWCDFWVMGVSTGPGATAFAMTTIGKLRSHLALEASGCGRLDSVNRVRNPSGGALRTPPVYLALLSVARPTRASTDGRHGDANGAPRSQPSSSPL